MSKKGDNRQPRVRTLDNVPRARDRKSQSLKIAVWLGVTAVVVGLLTAAFLATGKPRHVGDRLASGPAPAFAVGNVVNGRMLTSSDLKGRDTLLFFSEGVMCQACLAQIQSLEKVSGELAKRRLSLVSITPDSPATLGQAAAAYKIHTPLLSDESRRMSTDYDVLGLGMHPDMPGHTFILVDAKGMIRWRHDYTTMYVPPADLLKEIPKLS